MILDIEGRTADAHRGHKHISKEKRTAKNLIGSETGLVPSPNAPAEEVKRGKVARPPSPPPVYFHAEGKRGGYVDSKPKPFDDGTCVEPTSAVVKTGTARIYVRHEQPKERPRHYAAHMREATMTTDLAPHASRRKAYEVSRNPIEYVEDYRPKTARTVAAPRPSPILTTQDTTASSITTSNQRSTGFKLRVPFDTKECGMYPDPPPCGEALQPGTGRRKTTSPSHPQPKTYGRCMAVSDPYRGATGIGNDFQSKVPESARTGIKIQSRHIDPAGGGVSTSQKSFSPPACSSTLFLFKKDGIPPAKEISKGKGGIRYQGYTPLW